MMIMRAIFLVLFSLIFLAAGLITGAFLLLAILALGGVFLAMLIRQKLTGKPISSVRFYRYRGHTHREEDGSTVIDAEYREVRDDKRIGE